MTTLVIGNWLWLIGKSLVQEGRRQEAEGGRKPNLYSKVFSLFQPDSYFRPVALAITDYPSPITHYLV